MPPRPYFFLSYARDDLKGELTFFDDLVETVRHLTGIPREEIGFRDAQDYPIASFWTARRAEAVQQCGAFVYLHSPTYWKREWCGKEWYVFQSRLQGLVPRPELMLPVLWVNRSSPAAVAADIQFTHADFGPKYARYGLKQLMQVGMFAEDYHMFLRNFAERIVDAVDSYSLPPDNRVLDFDQIPNAFLPNPLGVPAPVVGPQQAQAVKVIGRRDEHLNSHSPLDVYESAKQRGREVPGNRSPTSSEGVEKLLPKTSRDKVFISYCHKDIKFLEQLVVHLKPLERPGLVTEWSDKQIVPGSKWLDDIQAALASTKVAVMMVTSHFLASDFIRQHELGPLLKEAEQGGVRILWIPIRACSYKETPLKNYQAVSDPDRPLAQMKAERDGAWVKVCEEIKKALNS